LSSIPNAVTEGEDSAVLAIGIDRRNNAHLAAIYAVRILKGEVLPGELPVGIVTPPDVAINFRVARKIGLKIPLSFVESAAFIYDYYGKLARAFGELVD
jgi:putative ABC transport system substrate-binding protein